LFGSLAAMLGLPYATKVDCQGCLKLGEVISVPHKCWLETIHPANRHAHPWVALVANQIAFSSQSDKEPSSWYHEHWLALQIIQPTFLQTKPYTSLIRVGTQPIFITFKFSLSTLLPSFLRLLLGNIPMLDWVLDCNSFHENKAHICFGA
jgi:hypothetical protein